MISKSTAGRKLDVTGTVELDSADGRLVLEGIGDTVRVSSMSVGAMRSVADPLLRLNRTVRRRNFEQFSRGLAAADVELTFHIDRWEIARLGGRTGSGLVARGLATPGLRVRWLRALGALLLSR
ncbi:MAG: hypothetical protein WBO43_06270 [Gemmatimonadota bacterium]